MHSEALGGWSRTFGDSRGFLEVKPASESARCTLLAREPGIGVCHGGTRAVASCIAIARSDRPAKPATAGFEPLATAGSVALSHLKRADGLVIAPRQRPMEAIRKIRPDRHAGQGE